jgi:hypothetical protein
MPNSLDASGNATKRPEKPKDPTTKDTVGNLAFNKMNAPAGSA